MSKEESMQGGVGGGGAGANEEKTEGLMDEIMKHPLFMDPSKITVGIHRLIPWPWCRAVMFACVLQAQDFETNEDLAALRAIQYSESDTPEYLAEKAKKRGNQAFARGPQYYKHALRYYSVWLLLLVLAVQRDVLPLPCSGC